MITSTVICAIMENKEEMTENAIDHKLVIRCPVAEKPGIFNEINGSIINLQKTIDSVKVTAEEGLKIGKTANRKVDRIYIVLGFIAAMVPIIGLIVHLINTAKIIP